MTGAGEQMQIFVMPGHRTLTLDVRPSAKVAVVKQMIHIRTLEQSFYQRDAAGVPADTIKLEYGGRVLDDERPLSHYGVADNATLAFDFNWEPKTSSSEEKLLYVKYPADKMAFTSDCIYAVKPTHTVADLRRMIQQKEGIIVRGKIYDQIWSTAVPPLRYQIGDRATLEKIFNETKRYKGSRVPTVYVTHFSRIARAARNVTRLATDLLREVLSYSELRTLAASASTCRVLRDAVPPKLAHKLVLRKFPILSTIVDASTPMPPARELFESQTRLFDGETPDVSPTHSLDEYVFSVELTVDSKHKHVGTGVVLDNTTEAEICFSIPKGLWDATHTTEDAITANVMATRRGTLRRAALFSGGIEEGDGTCFYFDWNRIPSKSPMAEWLNEGHGNDNVFYKPLLRLHWHEPGWGDADAGMCKLTARFLWDSDDNADPMNLEDACLTLEHWCKL